MCVCVKTDDGGVVTEEHKRNVFNYLLNEVNYMSGNGKVKSKRIYMAFFYLQKILGIEAMTRCQNARLIENS